MSSSQNTGAGLLEQSRWAADVRARLKYGQVVTAFRLLEAEGRALAADDRRQLVREFLALAQVSDDPRVFEAYLARGFSREGLASFLSCADVRVVTSALEAMRTLECIDQVPEMMRLRERPEPPVRQAALETIRATLEHRAADQLETLALGLMARAAPDDRAAGLTLLASSVNAAFLRHVLPFLDADDARVRHAAMQAVDALSALDGLTHLLPALLAAPPRHGEVWQTVLRHVSPLQPVDPRLLPVASQFVSLLDSTDAAVRDGAIQVLAAAKQLRPDALVAMLQRPDASDVALSALVELDPEVARPHLVAALTGPSAVLRAAALQHHQWLDPRQHAAVVSVCLDDDDDVVAARAKALLKRWKVKPTTDKRLAVLKTRGIARPDDLVDPLLQTRLASIAKALAASARPSVRVIRGAPSRAKVTPGATRFGGLPDVPPAFEWPVHAQGGPMAFVAQVNLKQVHAVWPDSGVPAQGLLSFFVAQEHLTDGPQPPWHAVVFTADPRLCRPADPPAALPAKARFGVTVPKLRFEYTLPASLPQAMNTGGALSTPYHRFLEAIGQAPNAPADRLLGHPNAIQGDPLEVAPGHVLLLQVDSHRATGMQFGDDGRVFFLIDPADLARQRFDRVQAEFQTF